MYPYDKFVDKNTSHGTSNVCYMVLLNEDDYYKEPAFSHKSEQTTNMITNKNFSAIKVQVGMCSIRRLRSACKK